MRQECGLHVLVHRQLREDVGALERAAHADAAELVRRHAGHIAPVQHDATCVGTQVTGDQVEQRRFARAVGPDDRADAALGHVERPALQVDHIGQLGVVHVDDVERLAGHEGAVEVGLRIDPRPPQTVDHVVELAVDRSGDERPVLLELQLSIDPGCLPVLHDDLGRIQEVGAVRGAR